MRFDLIYVEQDGVRTMAAGFFNEGSDRMVGPFPAKEAGPKIVDALLKEPAFGFADSNAAETAYTVAHMRNMQRGANDAGQSYPYRITTETSRR